MGRLFFVQKDLGLLLTQMVCILEKGYKKKQARKWRKGLLQNNFLNLDNVTHIYPELYSFILLNSPSTTSTFPNMPIPYLISCLFFLDNTLSPVPQQDHPLEQKKPPSGHTLKGVIALQYGMNLESIPHLSRNFICVVLVQVTTVAVSL